MKTLFILLIVIFVVTFIYTQKQSNNTTVYVSPIGNDINKGSKLNPFKTIQKAINSATSGTTISVLPGVYRESIIINNKGTNKSPLRITADPNLQGPVILTGSVPSSDYLWEECDNKSCSQIPSSNYSKIFYTKLNENFIPKLLYEIASDATVKKLNVARSPNYIPPVNGRISENWWSLSDSELSDKVLVDKIHLKGEAYLSGATVHIVDGGSRCGNFIWNKEIDSFDSINGKLYFKGPIGFSFFGSNEKGIGPYSKYYIENRFKLLDAPGEWYYDQDTKRLFLWPLGDQKPQKLNIEISNQSNGIELNNASNIEINGLTFRFFGGYSALIINPQANNIISNIKIQNIKIEYSENGININGVEQSAVINNVTVLNSTFSNIENSSIMVNGKNNYPSNITDIKIIGSDFNNNSLLSTTPDISLTKISKSLIKNNHIHDDMMYGIHMFGYEKDAGRISDIYIENNVIENVCQSISACGGLKFFGGKYLNTIVTGNIIRNNSGYSNCDEKHNGKGYAHGIFISNASGIKLTNNIILNNTGDAIHVYPRQIEANNNVFLNNLVGYSSTGINLANPEGVADYDPTVFKTRHENTVIKNNVILYNGIGIQLDPANPEKVAMDYNAFISNIQDIKMDKTTGNKLWNIKSINTDLSIFKNANGMDFNIGFGSTLRGKGEPQLSIPLLQFQLDILGLSTDIGPCKFKWFGNSCPLLK